ncbi:MAG: archease [Nanoarchaeota archaeon]|nr:archease [Nanoarchaeota archaeon]MBU1445170.1 archease [Nanoarchaeota archaeon]MBU2420879.1 archease [Nanoarchaeota archaeon]MBU2475350.1 archease [Nanoarchaeota archaeon]MBU3940805.1 archease [Nanoarchaeota archaeon]
MKFKFIENLTSDVMFEAYGKDLKELFENSAIALFNVICKISKVKTIKFVEVEIEGENIEDLLINWLQELIALVDIKEMFFSKFEILEISEKKLKAKVYGEKISPEKGETVVKAVTYHNFKLEKNKKGYTTRVVFDI